MSSLPAEAFANSTSESAQQASGGPKAATPRIKFAVIGINHAHINSQVERGDSRRRRAGVGLRQGSRICWPAFTKRFPQAKLARSENEILEDSSVQLVLSSGIPDERAPLGIRVMQHGKDYMADKPGITTLEQLAEVRRVQAETKRIYSIMYSERFENRATVKAGELVKAGAIGRVIQTVGLGPHRMTPETRPAWFFERRATAASSATSARTRPISSCSSPARRRPRSWRRRSATCTIRSTRGSRTSAT